MKIFGQSANSGKIFLLVEFLLFPMLAGAQPPCASNPVANDYCASATPICNLNGYCGNTSATYTNYVNPTNQTNETNSPLGSVFCATIQNNSWLKFIADSTAAIFDVWVSNCANNHGIQMRIYSTTDCYNFTPVSNCWNPQYPTNGQITAVNLVPGNAYYFMIDGTQGDVCDYVITSNTGVSTGPSVTANQHICKGSSINLTATGGTGYTWSSSPADPNLNAQNTNATIAAGPAVTTTYTVTVTNPGLNAFCPQSNNILSSTVTVINLNSTMNNVIPASCNQDNGTATVLITGGVGTTTYLWNTNPPQTTATATSLPAGTWLVTATNSDCFITDTAVITTVPMLTASIDTIINTTCSLPNGSARIILNGGILPYTFHWSSSPIQTTQNLTNVYAGAYKVTVTDNANCAVILNLTITDSPAPIAYVTDIVDVICGQSTGKATANGSGGRPPYSFLWNTTPPQTTATALNLNQGIYTVSITDQNNCTGSADATVNAINGPVIVANAANAHCGQADGSAEVTVSSGIGSYSFAWSNGQTTPVISGLTSGIYTISVSDGWCTSTATVTLIDIKGPEASLHIYPTVLTTEDDSVTFMDYSTGNVVSWSWQLGDGTYGNKPGFRHMYKLPGNYNVILTVTDDYNCPDTASARVIVKDIFTFYIPNSFTPNGDGINDCFMAFGNYVDPDGFEMMIFDRWDKLVFRTNKWQEINSEPWNGNYNNDNSGDPLTSDVYVYMIRLREIDGNKHQYKGKVLILR